MNKLDIYNIALAQHGKKCVASDLTSENKSWEVEACDRFYKMACENAMCEYDWSFFVKPVDVIKNDDKPFGGWTHGYKIPDCVLRIARVSVNAKPFRVLSGRYYTNEDDPQIWGIRRDSEIMGLAPESFASLVGIYLGYLISTVISPSDVNLAQRILQNYSAQMSALKAVEENNIQDTYYSDDGPDYLAMVGER